MPDWLYRILRLISPSLRAQEARLKRTNVILAEARATRRTADRVGPMLRSYIKSGRRLDDLRGHQ